MAGLLAARMNRIKSLEDYSDVVAHDVLDEIRQAASRLSGVTVLHVNATSYGGGVVEILDSLVLLMNDLDVRTDWRVIHGTPDYFEVTKKFHNALQGEDVTFSASELELYKRTNEKFSAFAFLDHDCVIIHDPQPLALVHYTQHTAPWVWRCHIDITRPNELAWGMLSPFMLQYERMIVSSEGYRRPDLAILQQVMAPSIDPYSPKNRALSEETIRSHLERHGIPTDLPLITQVSRLDPWKDPEGVLAVFEQVKREVDCRLVFCYNLASDDPEGTRIEERMLKLAQPYLAKGEVLFVRGDDPLLVNALQRHSSVILQKSTREGFGLVITEAMWKGAAVVASNVGAIPRQIEDGVNGFLVEPTDTVGCAAKVVQLLTDRQLAAEMGHAATESVRKKFLITRHLLDYLNLIAELIDRP